MRLPILTRINDRTNSNELIVNKRTVRISVNITSVEALLEVTTRPVI